MGQQRPNGQAGILGSAPALLPAQEILLPSAFSSMAIQDPTWNMDTDVTAQTLAYSSVDVKNAFLNGDLSETVYMHQPPGFVDPRYPHHVCRLQRSLYGLKQAPRAWFNRFAAYATRVEFSPSRCDFSLFIYKSGTNTAYLLIYVDDIVLTTSSIAFLQNIIFSLHREFDITDLGALNHLLGISVTYDTTGMFLSQKRYAIELPERAHMLNCNPTRTPVDTNSNYMHPRDLLFWLTQTLIGLVALLLADLHLGVANVVAEMAWLRNLLQELHTPLLTATLVYCDNVSAVYLSINPVQHQRTKHIEIDIHFVRDMVAMGHVRVLHVPSRY
ncbi:ribonuclease H-like domain-containing protein [Tanacetum coccineum]